MAVIFGFEYLDARHVHYSKESLHIISCCFITSDVSISPYFKLLLSRLQLKRSVLNDIRWDPHRFQIQQSDDQRTMIYSQVIRNPRVL